MPFKKKSKSLPYDETPLKEVDSDEDIDLDADSKKNIKIVYECRNFKHRLRKERHEKTGKVINARGEVVFKNHNLASQVTSYGVYASGTETTFFGRARTIINVHVLMLHFDQINNQRMYFTPEMREFMDWATEERERLIERADHNIERGVIAFDQLWYLMKEKDRVVAKMLENQLLGLEITSRNYQAGNIYGEMYCINGQCIKTTGRYFYFHNTNVNIPEFHGVRDIADLRVQPPSEKTLKMLRKRGKVFQKVAKGHAYMQYRGNMFLRKQWGSHMYSADGRLMVDVQNFLRINPDYPEFKDPSAVNVSLGDLNSEDDAALQLQQRGKLTRIPPEQLALTWPTVAGFSFATKVWGEILVSGLSKINFDDSAFDQLVLDESKKHLIQGLVANHQKYANPFGDIISGKGLGKIFLLHGPPGVGKTLTAEAIAEYLHQPLYSISVGELGTTTKDLETKLNEILEMAAIWNAVILIDEADIFLEQRTNSDIMRNGMVGIFLRMLEYHSGVLFLTTNRVKVFDRAFHSRISVALKYDPLDRSARKQIWKNFLSSMRNSRMKVDDLAKFELNGRQIRTAVQLAQSLAFAEGAEKLTKDHLIRTLDIAEQFNHQFGDWQDDQDLDTLIFNDKE